MSTPSNRPKAMTGRSKRNRERIKPRNDLARRGYRGGAGPRHWGKGARPRPRPAPTAPAGAAVRPRERSGRTEISALLGPDQDICAPRQPAHDGDLEEHPGARSASSSASTCQLAIAVGRLFDASAEASWRSASRGGSRRRGGGVVGGGGSGGGGGGVGGGGRGGGVGGGGGGRRA